MNNRNRHNFEFCLPEFPTETIGQMPGSSLKLKMDGKDLQGVTDLTVRAGSNGFTNVVIQFEASCAVNFVGQLVAQLKTENLDVEETKFADIYQQVKQEFEDELNPEGSSIENDYIAKAQFTRRIIELAMEQL